MKALHLKRINNNKKNLFIKNRLQGEKNGTQCLWETSPISDRPQTDSRGQ